MNGLAVPLVVNQARVNEVNSHCWAIVRELCESGQYATLEKVLTVLLQRYGVYDFGQLLCGELSNIPTLNLLMELNKKIGTFLTANLATASIVTVADLEWYCVQYLQSFEVPTLYSLHASSTHHIASGTVSTGADPNEVDLDDLDATPTTNNNTSNVESTDDTDDKNEEEPTSVSRFEEYGLGFLLHHPIVWCYFSNYHPPENAEDCCTTEHVLQILLEYLSEQKRQPQNKFSTFSVEDFTAYLCAELSISHVEEAGILIRGDLRAERIALEHTVNNRYTLYVETTKRELVHFNQQMALFQDNGRKPAKKRRKRSQEEETTDISATYATDVVAETDGVAVEEGEGEGVLGGSVVLSEVVVNEVVEVYEAEEVCQAETEIEVTATDISCSVKTSEAVNECAANTTTNADLHDTSITHTTNTNTTNTNTTNTSTASTTNTTNTTSTSSTTKTAKRTAPYEGSMNVYLPSGQASVTSTGAFKCGAHSEHADTGIRIVENWELQSILPYVCMNDVHNTYGDSVMGASSVDISCGSVQGNATGGYDTNWAQNAHFNPSMPPVPPNPYNTPTNNYLPQQASHAPYTTTYTHQPAIHTTYNTANYSASTTNNVTHTTTHTTTNTNSFNTALDSRAAGRWGEALIYQYLLSTAAPGTRVNWLNQQEESRACYDFIVHAPIRSHSAQLAASRMNFNQSGDSGNHSSSSTATNTTSSTGSTTGRESTEYIEVKSTRFADRNMFEISLNEWQFAAADSRVPYHIYRVFSAGDPQRVRLVIIEDVFRKVSEGRLKLCMAV